MLVRLSDLPTVAIQGTFDYRLLTLECSKMNKPMVKLIWNEDYWEHRAEEARAMGETIRNLECKRIMSDIAESYMRLARLTKAFQRAAGTPIAHQDPEEVRKH